MLVGLVALAALVRASWPSSSVDAQNVDTQVADAPAGSPVVLTADVASAPAVSVKTPASSVDPRITSEQASGAAVSTAEVSALAVSAKKPAPSPVVKTLNAAPAPAPATSRPVDTAAARVETAPAPPPPITSPADAPPALTATTLDAVTISGCLDYDGKSVWLKDASGVEAPRTRSWRSGFLKKRSPRIALVNGPTSASAYAGRRVSVTGVLVDREMHVDSLQPIASDCE